MTSLALLRGINVGGKHRVPMQQLRASFTALGMSDVTTYINSGNVLFTPQRDSEPGQLSRRIGEQLADDFGFAIPVLVVPGSDLRSIADAIPPHWANDATHKSDVLFLFPELRGPGALTRFPVRPGIDEALYESGAVIWHINRKDQSRTGLVTIVGTELYKQVTIRNVNTVRRLADMAAAAEARS